METATKRASAVPAPIGLNRTMQYGNGLFVDHIEGVETCLNRTMQYGNDGRYKYTGIACDMFKSYYVVWKRKVLQFLRQTYRRFKSYYVVWKLYFPVMFKFSKSTFKSYYVVWKHEYYTQNTE